MFKRILVGIFGIPLLLYIIYLGGIYFFVLTLILNFFCLYEFYISFRSKNIFPLKYFSILISYLLIGLAYKQDPLVLAILMLFIITLIVIEIFRKENKRSLLNPVIGTFGIFYITVPFMLLNIMETDFKLILYLITLIWVCDIFAYFTGKFLGKHKLTTISPNKTIEGAIGGFVFTLIVSFAFHFIIPDFIRMQDSLICGIIIGVFGQIGDLFESMIKRYTEIKDSSEIIPGHGGVLDRFDSLIFVTPIIYVYFNFLRF